MPLLLLLLACDGGPKPDDTGRDTDTAGDTDSGGDTDTGLPPTRFQACGVEVAVGPPVGPEGFVREPLPAIMPRDIHWVGEEAFAVDGRDLFRLDAGLVETGRRGSLPTALRLTAAAGHLFAGNGNAGISVVAMDEALTPLTWWSEDHGEDGQSWVRLVGAAHDRLVLDTSAGISLLDVGDPTAPVELGCAEGPADAFAAHTDGDFVVRSAYGEARVYDVSTDTPVDLGAVHAAEEVVAALDRGRMLVWEDDAIVLYALTPGAAPSVVTRVDLDTKRRQSNWDPQVLGGLVMHGGTDHETFWALDLRDDTLPLYGNTDPDGALWSCVAELTAERGGAVVELSPLWLPEERFADGELDDLPCPEVEPMPAQTYAGSLSADHTRLYYGQDGVWTRTELGDGATTPLGDAEANEIHPLGEGWVLSLTTGWDWGIPMLSTLTRYDDGGGELGVINSPGPFVALAPLADELWVLSEAVERDYGDPRPPAEQNILWKVTGTGGVEPVALPSGTASLDLVAGPDDLWVFDQDGFDLVHLDGEGGAIEECALPGGHGAGPRVASSLGLFLRDDTGALLRVERGCVVTTLRTGIPDELVLAGADERQVYAGWREGPGERWAGWQGVHALDPETGEERGAMPTWRAPEVFVGARTVLAEYGLVWVERP